jgi:dTDP-4-amino-4,6-dideoxygalactose transaminase
MEQKSQGSGVVTMNFHQCFKLEKSIDYVQEALRLHHVAGDGPFTLRCANWLKEKLICQQVLMTTSCTHALELAVRALDLSADDEVILPSFTYPSTANAVLLAGAKVVYSEVEGEHFNLDPQYITEKITSKTKAILVVHYGGIACDMDAIMAIAHAYGLWVIEDAAQGFLATYKGKALGTIGHLGCLSFHGTKDVVSGEGGALLINDERFNDFCETYRLKGTNRKAFTKGQVPYYQWTTLGSSYSPSDVLMALLLCQLENSHQLLTLKQNLFKVYEKHFETKQYPQLESFSRRSLTATPNGHLFYIVFKTVEDAITCQDAFKEKGIPLYTHFIPLHDSQMGRQFVRPNNHFHVERDLGRRLLRLPIYADMGMDDALEVIGALDSYLGGAV